MLYLYDVLTLVGIGLIGVGLYLVYPPLALIVVGTLLLVLGLIAGRGAGRSTRAREAGRR